MNYTSPFKSSLFFMAKVFLCICFILSGSLIHAAEESGEADEWVNLMSLDEILGSWEGQIFTVQDGIRFEIPVIIEISKNENGDFVSGVIADYSGYIGFFLDILFEQGIKMSEDQLWDFLVLLIMEEEIPTDENVEIIFENFRHIVNVTYPDGDRDRKFEYERYFINRDASIIRWYSSDENVTLPSAIIYRLP